MDNMLCNRKYELPIRSIISFCLDNMGKGQKKIYILGVKSKIIIEEFAQLGIPFCVFSANLIPTRKQVHLLNLSQLLYTSCIFCEHNYTHLHVLRLNKSYKTKRKDVRNYYLGQLIWKYLTDDALTQWKWGKFCYFLNIKKKTFILVL